jgi:hypothetical protein
MEANTCIASNNFLIRANTNTVYLMTARHQTPTGLDHHTPGAAVGGEVWMKVDDAQRILTELIRNGED